jgi:hypothetical protein
VLVHCCWCKRGCATGEAKVEPGQVVFCLFCAAMQLVISDGLDIVTPAKLRTRPLTIDELASQLRDPETMRVLCEVDGKYHA